MSVTVILIGYRGDEWLPACVSSLRRASSERLHLVLVDNDGNTIIDELDLTGFDAEILSTPRPMGFAEANNFGLIHASQLREKVLFLNQDTISPAGWIDRCLQELTREKALAAVSPVIRTYEDDGWDPSFLDCLTEEQQAALEITSKDVLPTDHVPAASLLMRTDVLRDTGPFDPVFGSYYEDYDLCRRIRESGYTVGFCPAAHIRHFSGSATISREHELERMRQGIRNRILYNIRSSDEPRLRIVLKLFLQHLPHRLARAIVGTRSSQPPTVVLKAYRDLLQIGKRLVSSRCDEAVWTAYLEDLGWPPQISSSPSPAPVAFNAKE
jgi:GT2 family glycosyltransferase